MEEYTVSEFNRKVKDIITAVFPQTIVIIGEVTGFMRASSGHIYFSIKDSKSQVRAVFFKNYANASKFLPKQGDKVRAIGDISLYEPDGSYQIIVKKIEYDSEGVLWKQFEELKRKLETEGLFDESSKKEIPKYPSKIAVITSETGAVIRDFLVTAKKEKGLFNIELWSVSVQGNAAGQIAAAINNVSKYKDRYDVIVVMRGGGSLEDLFIFNDEIIARAVYNSPIPVISAIGHERDFTIIDFVADYRAATPTAAAVYLSSHYKSASAELENKSKSLKDIMKKYIQYNYQKLDFLGLKIDKYSPKMVLLSYNNKINQYDKSISLSVKNILSKTFYKIDKYEKLIYTYNPKHQLASFNMRIDNSLKNLEININNKFNTHRSSIDVYINDTKSYVKNRINYFNGRLAELSKAVESTYLKKDIDNLKYKESQYSKQLVSIISKKYQMLLDNINMLEQKIKKICIDIIFEKSIYLTHMTDKLNLLNPDNVLERGYALVSINGNFVSSIEDVDVKENIEIKLKDGYIDSSVINIRDNNRKELRFFKNNHLE